jgi:putative two-component system response regulator
MCWTRFWSGPGCCGKNRRYQENLERLVRERTAELELTRRQVMQRLSRAAEYKDNETGHHVIRVGEVSALLGGAMGLSDERCEMLRECAPLHDVGKIGIPDAILLKPGPLASDEWEVMRQHCLYGCEILGPLISNDAARLTCQSLLDAPDAETNDLLHLARVWPCTTTNDGMAPAIRWASRAGRFP